MRNLLVVFCLIFALFVMYFAKGGMEAGRDEGIFILGIIAAFIAGWNIATIEEWQ